MEDSKINRSDCYGAFLEGFSNVLKASELNTLKPGDLGVRLCLWQGVDYHPEHQRGIKVPLPAVTQKTSALAELQAEASMFH